jgi:hypothetical protein
MTQPLLFIHAESKAANFTYFFNMKKEFTPLPVAGAASAQALASACLRPV